MDCANRTLKIWKGGTGMLNRAIRRKKLGQIGIMVASALLLVAVLTGCSAVPQTPALPPETQGENQETEGNGPVPGESDSTVETPEIDFNVVKPNELGEVMVIMYHSLGEKNSDYVRTPESFRQDLERLYAMGFRTLSLRDLVQGNITTPAGYTPVVLTFDDGHSTNFKVLEDQSIDPNSVVGIMAAFAQAHPEFGMHASFFFNGGTPFGQKEYVDFKFNYMLENGMDIGNHSYGHDHFKKLTAKEVEISLGKNAAALKAMLPEGYEIDLLALPYGERPIESERGTLISGQYEGTAYRHAAILNVGWKPSVSPYDASFDFASIQRVQSGDGHLQLTDWLDGYEKNPSKRFISDGRADRIVIPQRLADKIADVSKLGGREVLSYEDGQQK
jgi:peptidoglycan/xylan/chitin deacetylase (PgdA/CDA1 family)